MFSSLACICCVCVCVCVCVYTQRDTRVCVFVFVFVCVYARSSSNTYTLKHIHARALVRAHTQIFALSLGMSADGLADKFTQPICVLRLLHYSACPSFLVHCMQHVLLPHRTIARVVLPYRTGCLTVARVSVTIASVRVQVLHLLGSHSARSCSLVCAVFLLGCVWCVLCFF